MVAVMAASGNSAGIRLIGKSSIVAFPLQLSYDDALVCVGVWETFLDSLLPIARLTGSLLPIARLTGSLLPVASLTGSLHLHCSSHWLATQPLNTQWTKR